ncbi:hypothetical protein [Vibrio agarivorans]|uniref:Uncharacterized protein n=1 Tax=Vibrio agarivorans TaxID=153622 RepID=A0ABT7Y713_9VIBR|nr:hypothetical protein [Vibrio agarivorans]MDN2483839.1 hypothetical protein [Vibrio agarivorans]
MKYQRTIIAIALALAGATSIAASNNPYDKVGDGIPSVSVSSDSLVKKVNKNTGDINSLDKRTTSNEELLATHGDRLDKHESDINSNRISISQNATDIATNKTSISLNRSNISSNTSAISRNTTNISTNATNISKNASNISSNTSRIGSLEGRMTSAEADIRTANNRLNDHANTLADHERRISQNEDDIASGGGNGPGQCTSGWQTIYSGSGSSTISASCAFSEWKATVKYNGSKTYSTSGNAGGNLTLNHKTTGVQDCSVNYGKRDLEATAQIKVPVSQVTTIPSHATKTEYYEAVTGSRGGCEATSITSTITGATFTKFEVRYP